jgi:hypothetical protein
VECLITDGRLGRPVLAPASWEMDLEYYGFLWEPNDVRLNIPLGGSERRGPDTHQLCGSPSKEFPVSILDFAEPDHEKTMVLLAPGTKLVDLFGCWSAKWRVCHGEVAHSPATEACTGPTNPAAPQHVGAGRVTNCDDPDWKRHQALESGTNCRRAFHARTRRRPGAWSPKGSVANAIHALPHFERAAGRAGCPRQRGVIIP